jgi:hypothetical protein
MNNTDHARVRRLRRRANRLGAEGCRIVPHRVGSGTFARDGWHLIENGTNQRIAPPTGNEPVTLDEVEAAIERLEEAATAR